MKSDEEIMEILEAFDLTRSFRDAGELASCSPNTVAHWVGVRDQETPQIPARREQLIDAYLPKLEEWVDASHGKVRADVAHDKLVALGYTGSERTTRRAVAAAKKAHRDGRRRIYRPWVPEPGMWFQYDFGEGPVVAGVATVLFCAWLSWSRFRVVIPILDKSLPSVIASIDVTLRRFGGCPTYALTDNEKTVTTTHVARIAIRNADMVSAARHYGLTIATCVVADPESKGGSEATVRIAKADLVPTDANLLPAYAGFAALEAACDTFCEEVNTRAHRVTRRAPAEMLAEERRRLHRLPRIPYTAAFGVTRIVGLNTPVIALEGCEYSVPHRLRGETVWARAHGEEIVLTHVGSAGAIEVARHERTTPGNPRHVEEHFGPTPEGPLQRIPRATNDDEAAFLSLGAGAALWLGAAGEAGVARPRAKMAEAVSLAALHGIPTVDWALGHAAVMGRFAEGDLASIIAHHASAGPGEAQRATEDHTLQP
ncbi:MAG TPA: IS21 family transposase, partial [Acidimicrobiales bacterium]|nr:IS21 family transposase [Acidimicrobiales bacterium]